MEESFQNGLRISVNVKRFSKKLRKVSEWEKAFKWLRKLSGCKKAFKMALEGQLM